MRHICRTRAILANISSAVATSNYSTDVTDIARRRNAEISRDVTDVLLILVDSCARLNGPNVRMRSSRGGLGEVKTQAEVGEYASAQGVCQRTFGACSI